MWHTCKYWIIWMSCYSIVSHTHTTPFAALYSTAQLHCMFMDIYMQIIISHWVWLVNIYWHSSKWFNVHHFINEKCNVMFAEAAYSEFNSIHLAPSPPQMNILCTIQHSRQSIFATASSHPLPPLRSIHSEFIICILFLDRWKTFFFTPTPQITF